MQHTEATVGKSGNQKNDSVPPSFGKQPVLLLHLISDAADLGLTLIDFCHLTLYTHRGEKKSQKFQCKFTMVTETAQT